MMVPKMAREIAQTMMVFILFPSHTIKMGAKAVFGRLFNVIRKGSKIFAIYLFHHKSMERPIPITKTIKKLKNVSNKVILTWCIRLPSKSMV